MSLNEQLKRLIEENTTQAEVAKKMDPSADAE